MAQGGRLRKSIPPKLLIFYRGAGVTNPLPKFIEWLVRPTLSERSMRGIKKWDPAMMKMSWLYNYFVA